MRLQLRLQEKKSPVLFKTQAKKTLNNEKKNAFNKWNDYSKENINCQPSPV